MLPKLRIVELLGNPIRSPPLAFVRRGKKVQTLGPVTA